MIGGYMPIFVLLRARNKPNKKDGELEMTQQLLESSPWPAGSPEATEDPEKPPQDNVHQENLSPEIATTVDPDLAEHQSNGH